MRPISVTRTLSLLLLASATACGASDKDPAKSDKTAPTAKEPDKSETKKTDEPVASKKEVHFDITKDNSGILARTASTLETSDRVSTDNPVRSHLAEVSHHAEAGPSNEALCTHVTEVRATSPAEACAVTMEHERVLLGPEVFAQMAECMMAAKSEPELAACEAAELEAQTLLHEKKHGDGLSEEVCTNLFNHFETLAMTDAGEQAEVVKEILEEVRGDVVVACVDQGTKKEVDCAMAATNMEALGVCESALL